MISAGKVKCPSKSCVNNSINGFKAFIAPLDFQLHPCLPQCVYPSANHWGRPGLPPI